MARVVDIVLLETWQVRAGPSERASHGGRRGPRWGTESGPPDWEALTAIVGLRQTAPDLVFRCEIACSHLARRLRAPPWSSVPSV